MQSEHALVTLRSLYTYWARLWTGESNHTQCGMYRGCVCITIWADVSVGRKEMLQRTNEGQNGYLLQFHQLYSAEQ